MPTTLKDFVEELKTEFDDEFGGATGYCNPVFSKKIQSFLESSLLKMYSETLEMVEKGLPEKGEFLPDHPLSRVAVALDGGENLKIVINGYNQCRDEVLEYLTSLKIK